MFQNKISTNKNFKKLSKKRFWAHSNSNIDISTSVRNVNYIENADRGAQ